MDTRLSQDDLTGNPQVDQVSLARNIVLNQLNFMPRSRKELETTLIKRKIEPEVAKQVLDRFVEIEIVDDAAFAELLVRSRCNTKRVSRSVLRQQLRQKGIDQEIIDEALLAVTDADELRMATQLVEKKLRAMTQLAPEVRKRRLFGLLARKGYGTAIALKVINDLQTSGSDSNDSSGDESISNLA